MENAPDRTTVESQLIERALKDNVFRQELMDDPKLVLEREFGVVMPANLTVVVHLEDADTFHMVLPHVPDAMTELGADELMADDCSGWGGQTAVCMFSCTQCSNTSTSCGFATDGPPPVREKDPAP